MDPMTIAGVILGVAAVLGAAILEGTHMSALLAPSALLIIAGGTVGATSACFTLPQLKTVMGQLGLLIKKPGVDIHAIIDTFAEMATVARRDGILALENRALPIDSDFARRGLRMIVDGINPELVKQMLMTDLYTAEEGLKTCSAVFKTAGGFAPTMGIIGTVVGLIHVLGNLSKPETLGPSIAMAFIATFYGVASANLILLPIANKFGTIAKEESALRVMIIEGLLAIYAGDSPHVVRVKLQSFLTDKERAGLKAA